LVNGKALQFGILVLGEWRSPPVWIPRSWQVEKPSSQPLVMLLAGYESHLASA
jgi:hypothetical protein